MSGLFLLRIGNLTVSRKINSFTKVNILSSQLCLTAYSLCPLLNQSLATLGSKCLEKQLSEREVKTPEYLLHSCSQHRNHCGSTF